MAEGTLVVKSSAPNTAGVAALVSADVDGDKFINDGETMLLITVGSTETHLTVVSVPCSHGRTGDLAYDLAINQEYLLGPWPKDLFNDSNGYCHVTYDQVTNVKIAAIRKS